MRCHVQFSRAHCIYFWQINKMTQYNFVISITSNKVFRTSQCLNLNEGKIPLQCSSDMYVNVSKWSIYNLRTSIWCIIFPACFHSNLEVRIRPLLMWQAAGDGNSLICGYFVVNMLTGDHFLGLISRFKKLKKIVNGKAQVAVNAMNTFNI